MVIDPVCKMRIDETKAAGRSEYHGTVYYFCAVSCKITFDKEPEKYAGTAPKGSGPASQKK